MQIIIDIPESLYRANIMYGLGLGDIWDLRVAVAEGIPIPEGHGRLIDADELKKEYPKDSDWDYPVNTNHYVADSIDNSTTILEADKGERSDKE